LERKRDCINIDKLNDDINELKDNQRMFQYNDTLMKETAAKLQSRIVSRIYVKRKRSSFKKLSLKRRPYRNYTGIDFGSLFQFASLLNNLKYAAKSFNIPRETFRRHFKVWKTLGRPFYYEIEEKRGRESMLTDEQSQSM
jgi:hypothetical protein